MATLEVRDLCKSFGAVGVLKDVSFALPEGEFLALVGPSGCGKSTLLRMIAGLETVSSGTVRIGDRIVNDLAPKDRDIAMVFQSYALYPNLTVARNIAQPLRLAGQSRAEIDRKVAEAAAVLGLDGLLDRYPRALSGGQRQRVAMGRAIVRAPQLFLFDEPLSNLDAQLRVQMRADIKEIVQRIGTTTVYVTHDQIEAMTMADRVAVMRAGRIEQIGTPLDLYDRPANVFVAGFMGSPAMNMIGVQVGRLEEGGTMLTTDAGTSFAIAGSAPVAQGGRLVFGVRPEALDILPGGTPAPPGVLPATVRVIEATGADTQIILRAGPTDLRVFLRERRNIHPGDEVHVTFPSEAVHHFFDSDTGDRIGA